MGHDRTGVGFVHRNSGLSFSRRESGKRSSGHHTNETAERTVGSGKAGGWTFGGDPGGASGAGEDPGDCSGISQGRYRASGQESGHGGLCGGLWRKAGTDLCRRYRR